MVFQFISVKSTYRFFDYSRTGTIIACDIALRALEQPTRSVDIPQIVYFVRRGRASAVRTREQYEFIYKVSISLDAVIFLPCDKKIDYRSLNPNHIHSVNQLVSVFEKMHPFT